MADEFSKEKLDDYNDSLRETLNYSRQLSENILKAAGRMALLSQEARMTRRLTSELESDIKKTIGLTDKLNAGKLKSNEAQRQLNQLQNKYTKYVEEAANVSSDVYKTIEDAKSKQIQYQRDLNSELTKEAQLKSEIRQEDLSIDAIQRRIASRQAALTNANIQDQSRIRDQIRNLQTQVRQHQTTINLKEQELKSTQKIIDKTKESLATADRIVEAHDAMISGYQELIKQGEVLVAGTKKYANTSEGIVSTLKDIKNLLNPFTAIFDFIKKMAFAASDQVTRIQKGLVVSREEAYELRQGFNDAAVASGNIAVNTERMVAANAELGKQLGFNSRFSNDMNIEFIKLTKQIGLSDEAAGGLAKLSKATGMNFKDTKNVVLETTQRLSSQYGIQLDQKDVLEEIGKISGQTLAMLKGNPKALTEAVAQARLLGTNLDTVKKQASALLDFETSIENELQAELITGRQFNLERARTASLTGDLTTTMKELNSQGIDFNNFSNMNVIAQEKVAAALGMQTDELSDQLLKQQYMGMSREQVAALAGEEVAKRLEALSAQDKFNLALEKMQDAIGQIVSGPLGQLVDLMATALESSAGLYGMILAIAGISLGKTLASLATLALELELSAAGAIATASAISFGLAAVGIIAGIAAMMGAFSDSQDEATSVGDLSYSKGKTIISTKEGGLFEPSPNDDIAVAPGIGDMINKPSQTVVNNDNSAVVSAVNTLNTTMQGVSTGISDLKNKQSVVNLNGQFIEKFGTAQNLTNYNLA